jgi:hypothetical protein
VSSKQIDAWIEELERGSLEESDSDVHGEADTRITVDRGHAGRPVIREELRTPKSANDIAFDFERELFDLNARIDPEQLERVLAVRDQIDPQTLHAWKFHATRMHERAKFIEDFVGDIGVVPIREKGS